MGNIGAEARARLAAESDLLRRRKAEYERLLKTKSRIAAVVAMVEKHKREYDELVKMHRERLDQVAA